MGSYTQTARNIINGMSTQDDRYMVDGQCRFQQNAVPNPAEGTVKRPSTIHKKLMSWLDPNIVYTHFGIEIQGVEYLFSLSTNFLYISREFELIQTIDITGNVNGYLGDDAEALRVYYLDDTLYVLNTNAVVLTQKVEAISHATSATVELKGTSTNKTYTVTVKVYEKDTQTEVYSNSGNDEIGSTTTVNDAVTEIIGEIDGSTWFDKASSEQTMVFRLKPEHLETHYIAVETSDEASDVFVKKYVATYDDKATLPLRSMPGQKITVDATEGDQDDIYFKFVRNDDAILEQLSKGETIQIKFDFDGREFSLFVDTDDLIYCYPIADITGADITAEVTEINRFSYDDAGTTKYHYQIYKDDDTELAVGDILHIGTENTSKLKIQNISDRRLDVGDGIWVETAREGTNSFLPMTMPATLELDSDTDTWTLRESEWLYRSAGNETSSKFPAFVDKTINSLFEVSGRLLFTYDNGTFPSRTGDFTNLFRVTATDYLITDAFPLNGDNITGTLYTPITLNGNIFLWGDKEQLKLSGSQIGLATSSLIGVSKYSSDLEAYPVVTGSMIHYISKTNEYNILNAYATRAGTESSMFSEPVSDQINTLMLGNITTLLSNYATNSLVITTDDDKTKMFLYNYYLVNGELRQSAWSILQFPFEIEYVYITSNIYNFVVKYDNNYHIVQLNLKDISRPQRLLMDMEQDVTLINGTAIVPKSSGLTLYDNQDYPGAELDYVITPIDNDTMSIFCEEVAEEAEFKCKLGKHFTMKYTLRQPVVTTNQGTAIMGGVLYLQNLGLDLGKTGAFDLVIENDDGSIFDEIPSNISDLPADLTQVPENDYIERFNICARSDDDLDVTVVSDNQFPMTIKGLYWEFQYNRRRTAI